MEAFDPTCLQDLLRPYYDLLFPFNLMYKWLSYGSDDLFSRREFSFTLAGDVYIRYQSFSNGEEYTKEVRRRTPEKIDIGAVYTHRPKHRDSFNGFQPVEKEFVLDIDLTDYDEVRTCCSGAKVCEKCWKFLAVAVKVLNVALRDDFGFKHVLWVYSGRRGVHCWICDPVAREMDSYSRSSVIEYLNVIRGGENQSKKVSVKGTLIHPLLRRSINIIQEYFDEICDEDQNLLSVDKIFNILPDDVKQAARNPVTRYADAMNFIRTHYKPTDKQHKYTGTLEDELMLQFCYPRLDINVSKGLNHLLKSPFCVHPKTGQVCVPFDPKHVDEFKTTEVPKITELLDEIAEHDKATEDKQSNMHAYKKTKLKSYIDFFNKFVKQLPVNSSTEKQEQMEF